MHQKHIHPKISVIMPISEKERNVLSAVRGILTQSFEDIELILPQEISFSQLDAKNELLKDKRIKFISCHHKNDRIKFINNSFKLCRGKFICLADTNYIHDRNRLKIQKDFLEKNDKISLIGSSTYLVEEDKRKVGLINTLTKTSSIKVQLLKSNPMVCSSIMLRNEAVKKFYLRFDERIGGSAEYDFILKCTRKLRVENISDPLISCQLAPESKHVISTLDDVIRLRQLNAFNLGPTLKEINLHLKIMNEEEMPVSEAQRCVLWCKRLLRQNIKLQLYNNNELFNLLDTSLGRMFLVKHQKKLGGWSIGNSMVNFINTQLRENSVILEFGSGYGTSELLKKYYVISIEHDQTFAMTRSFKHTCVYAPIVDGWYKRNNVQSMLSYDIGLILVDGPPRELRSGILKNIDLFRSITCPIIFDDVDRPLDKKILEAFCEKLNYTYIIYNGESKQFAYCFKEK